MPPAKFMHQLHGETGHATKKQHAPRILFHFTDDSAFRGIEFGLHAFGHIAQPVQQCGLVFIDGEADRRGFFHAALTVVFGGKCCKAFHFTA